MSFMTGSNQSLMNCTRTSSNLGLTWGRQISQAHGRGGIGSKGSSELCEIFSKPQTVPAGSGIEKEESTSECSDCVGGVFHRDSMGTSSWSLAHGPRRHPAGHSNTLQRGLI